MRIDGESSRASSERKGLRAASALRPKPASASRRSSRKAAQRIRARADRVPDRRGRALAHPREDLERALPRQLVLRIDDDAQEGEDVLDVALLEEAGAGADLVRDAATRQLDLELERLIVGAVEHGQVLELLPLVVPLQQPLRDEARLLGDVGQAPRRRAAAPLRATRAAPWETGARCGRSTHWRELRISRRRAVVARQAERLRLRIALRKPEDVLERRAAEGVDRLRVVADDRHVALDPGHAVDDVALQRVGVLVLVHQDVVVGGGELRRGLLGLSSSRRFQRRSRSS